MKCDYCGKEIPLAYQHITRLSTHNWVKITEREDDGRLGYYHICQGFLCLPKKEK